MLRTFRVDKSQELTLVNVRTDTLTEEKGDASAALLVEGDLKSLGDGVFAGVVQPGEEDDEALLQARWVALAESLDNSAIAKKCRSVAVE